MIATQVVAAARREIRSGRNPGINLLDGAITSSAATVTFADELAGIKESAVLSVGLERMRVRTPNESARSATVIRGWDGTTAVAHSDGDLVRVGDPFDDFAIFTEVNNELRSLSSPRNGLFQMRATDLTYDSALVGYNLAGVTDMLGDPYELRYEVAGSVDAFWPLVGRYQLSRDMSRSEFSSSMALFIREGSHGETVRMRYRAPFSLLVALGDDVEGVTGLHAEAHDILSIGAAVRLIAPREVRRNFTDAQGDPRLAEEVPPGAVAASVRPLMALRRERIGEESSRLRERYPTRRRVA